MLVTLDKIDVNIADNIELWCTLYDYSSDDSGVELIPRYSRTERPRGILHGFCSCSEIFVIRDKDALRLQEHTVAFTVSRMC